MFNLAREKAGIKFNSRNSKMNVLFSDSFSRQQLRNLLERLDYLGIDALILHHGENDSFLSIEIGSVELFTVKRCKKVIETLFSGSTASIESIGGICYKEYMYQIGA